MNLITLKDLKALVGWTPESDQEVRETAEAVEEQWERDTRRKWYERDDHVQVIETEFNDEWLFLELYPLDSVTLTEYDNDPADAIPVAAEDYTVDVINGAVRRIRANSWKRFVTVVIGTGGYDADTLPKDIRKALVLETIRTLMRDSKEKITLKSNSTSGGGVGYMDVELRHPAFTRAINRYRRNAV